MAKIPELHQKILDTAVSPLLGKYIWERGVGPQMGYSFSTIHALAYSFIGVQTLYIARKYFYGARTITQKCSRIKKVFLDLMDEYRASYYIISGHTQKHIAGRVWFERLKVITLPRELVELKIES